MSEPNRTPEQIASDRIDQMLAVAGWSVQDKSQIDFNQAKGVAVREYPTDSGPADYDELKKVTPSAISRKTHFVIIDAVGVTKSLKTDSRPLERNPLVSFKDLLMSVLMGADDEETLTSLANFHAYGGLGRMWQLFGQDMDKIIDEMNEVLAA